MRTTARGSASASRTARLGTARLGTARLGVKPGNRYASRHSLGRRGSKVIHELSRVPPVPPERFPLRNDDAHPLTTHSNHPHKSTKSLKVFVDHPRVFALIGGKAVRRTLERNCCTADEHKCPRIAWRGATDRRTRPSDQWVCCYPRALAAIGGHERGPRTRPCA